MLVCGIADAEGKFLVKKLLCDLVELYFRRAGEVDVLGRNDHCLSGQGDGCGDGRLLALGGDHVFSRLVGACRIFWWVLSLRARFNDVC